MFTSTQGASASLPCSTMTTSSISLKRARAPSSSPEPSLCSRGPRKIRHLPKRRLRTSTSETPVLRASLTQHRSASNHWSSSDSDTEVDSSDTELGTALSDVEVDLSKGGSSPMSVDRDGDDEEIDISLMSAAKGWCGSSSSPVKSKVEQVFWLGGKGKRVDPREYGEGAAVSRKRRRHERDSSGGSEQEGDDEMEAEMLLKLKEKKTKRVKRPSPLKLKQSHKDVPTPSILDITQRVSILAADSKIDLDMPFYSSDEDDARIVSSSLLSFPPSPESPTPAYGSKACLIFRPPPNRARQCAKEQRRRRGMRPRPMDLTACEDPFVSLKALAEVEWKALEALPIPLSPMDVSDVEDGIDDMEEMDMEEETFVRKCLVPITPPRTRSATPPSPLIKTVAVFLPPLEQRIKAPRRPEHRLFAERLPGQKSTSQLRRRSPTSLLPIRRKDARSLATRRSHKANSFALTGAKIGQMFLFDARAQQTAQRARRTTMAMYNARIAESGAWRAMVGKWEYCDVVRASVDQWWLPRSPEPNSVAAGGQGKRRRHDEVEVEGMIGGDDEPMQVSPLKRTTSAAAGQQGAEVETRWARRNELRVGEEVRPHVLRVKAQRQARVEEETARREADAVVRRRLAAAAEAERRMLEATALEVPPSSESTAIPTLATPDVEQAVEVAVTVVERHDDAEEEHDGADASDSDESSSTHSGPPEYEFPSYPISLPRPAHLAIPPAPRSPPTRLPEYLPNRYSRRSPSPPPPYNARTDAQTLIAPVFIEDDEEEERLLRRVRPSGGLRSPSPMPDVTLSSRAIVGAFPEAAPSEEEAPRRSAWDAALDLEEGEWAGEDEEDEDDDVDSAVGGAGAQLTANGPAVLGRIGRLIGRVWRW